MATGRTVGEAIAAHPEIDMVSFTGSTAAGIRVAKLAADTVKRVAQELGGKSANIILADADLEKAVTEGVHACYTNGGQNCQSPTRMLVPRAQRDAAFAAAREAVGSIRLGDPLDPAYHHGAAGQPGAVRQGAGSDPVRHRRGRDAGRRRHRAGRLNSTAAIIVRPTVFGDVTPQMRIAREEIFGPVLSIMSYDSEDEAIEIANDTPFGLAGFVQSSDPDRARARRQPHPRRAASISMARRSTAACRSAATSSPAMAASSGVFGFEEYLEVKAILGR